MLACAYDSPRQPIDSSFELILNSLSQVYVHFTCALDTKNIEFVIRSVRDTVLRATLDEIGLGIDK